MYPTRSPWALLAWLISFPFAAYALLAAWYVLTVLSANYRAAETLYCASPAEARATGTFLDTALVTPRTVRYGAYTVEFTAGWVEQLRESHRPAWYARRVIRSGTAVRLRLGYRVRRHGPPPTGVWNAPVLTSNCTYAGYPIDHYQLFEVPGERLRPDYYHLPDPIELTLDDGPGDLPPQTFRVVLPRQGFIR